MTLLQYLAKRRKEVEERIAAEMLAGNDFKRDCERAALAELAGVEYVIRNERYYKISRVTDGADTQNVFDAHGMAPASALVNIIQHLVIEAVSQEMERRKWKVK